MDGKDERIGNVEVVDEEVGAGARCEKGGAGEVNVYGDDTMEVCPCRGRLR